MRVQLCGAIFVGLLYTSQTQNMSFARDLDLQPADVIVTFKSRAEMVQHYVIFIGYESDGKEMFMENKLGFGVRYVDGEQFLRENPTYTRIRKFKGNEYERQAAVERARSKHGENYWLFGHNCENFANFVQYDHSYSRQTGNFLGASFVLLVVAALLGAVAGGDTKRS